MVRWFENIAIHNKSFQWDFIYRFYNFNSILLKDFQLRLVQTVELGKKVLIYLQKLSIFIRIQEINYSTYLTAHSMQTKKTKGNYTYLQLQRCWLSYNINMG